MYVHVLWLVFSAAIGSGLTAWFAGKLNRRLAEANETLRSLNESKSGLLIDRGRHEVTITDRLHRELADVKNDLRKSEHLLGLTQEALERARNEKREIEQQMVLGLTKTGTLKQVGNMTTVREDILSIY